MNFILEEDFFSLSHLRLMFHFHTSGKCQKDFVTFSGVMQMKQAKIGSILFIMQLIML